MRISKGSSLRWLPAPVGIALALILLPLPSLKAQDTTARIDTIASSADGGPPRPGTTAPPQESHRPAHRTITPDSVDRAPITSISDLLQGRIPGLSVQRASGASGSASRIRLRGLRSTLASSTPLLIVDGLRVDMAGPAWPGWSGFGANPGDQWSSQLDALDPENVERIEVFGGPATAARYGFGAAAGAIVVTTRRGAGDGLHWAAHASSGAIEQRGDFPWSFDQRGIDAVTGAHIDYCGVELQAWERCTALPDSLLRSNVLATAAPFRTGVRSGLGINGSAGGELGSIYIATDIANESGTVPTNDARRRHVLGHGVIHPFRSLAIGARAGYSRASLSGWRPGGENLFSSALLGGPDDPDGYGVSPDTIAMLSVSRGARRFIFGGTATWEPARWLRVSGALGEDRNDWVDDEHPPAYSFAPGTRHWNRTSYYEHLETARLGASSSWQIGNALRATPSIGWDRVEKKMLGNRRWSIDDPSAAGLTSYSGFARNLRVEGLAGRVDLTWRNSVALGGGVRREKSRWFDDEATYRMVDASWALSAEPWFPHPGFLDVLRVRASYGEAGQSRTLLSNDMILLPDDPDDPTRVHQPSSSETELGVDMEAWHRRIALSITHYDGRSDAWYDLFYTQYIRHPGTIHSRGVEMALSASIVEAGSISAGLDVAAAFPRTRYSGYPHGVSQWQRVESGYPVGGYWTYPILGYTDLDQDGVISTRGCSSGEFPTRSSCEVALGRLSYVGSPTPTRELSLRPRISAHRVTLSALFDYRGGHELFNATDYFRCSNSCGASQDRRASHGEQARVAALALGSMDGFIEDAAFWKLRELSAAFAMPGRWAAALGAKRLSLALAARNLATWTRYGGLDPEVNTAPYESLGSYDLFAQPQVRYLLMRVDIGW